jgi:hypothetical protein
LSGCIGDLGEIFVNPVPTGVLGGKFSTELASSSVHSASSWVDRWVGGCQY